MNDLINRSPKLTAHALKGFRKSKKEFYKKCKSACTGKSYGRIFYFNLNRCILFYCDKLKIVIKNFTFFIWFVGNIYFCNY